MKRCRKARVVIRVGRHPHFEARRPLGTHEPNEGLRPWDEVARIMTAEGTPMTANDCRQTAQRAVRKIKALLVLLEIQQQVKEVQSEVMD